MMLWVAIGLALSIATGWLLVDGLDRRISAPLRGVMAVMVGLAAGSVGQLLVVVTHWPTLAIDATLLAIAFGFWRKLRLPADAQEPAKPLKSKWAWCNLGATMLAAAATSSLVMVASRYGQWDALAMWNLKAAFLYRDPSRWQQMFSPAIAHTSPDYPLMLPLTVARLWRYAGAETTWAPGVVSVLVTMSALTATYAAVAAVRGAALGAMACASVAATPFFVSQGGLQLADVPLSLMLLAGLSMAATACDRRGWLTAGLLLGIGAWLKNEGLLMTLAALIAAACLARRSVPWLALGAAPFVAMALLIKLVAHAPSEFFVEQSARTLLERITDVSRYTTILDYAFYVLWSVPGLWLWGAWIVYMVTAGIDARPRAAAAKITALTLLIIVVGYGLVYLITPRDLRWHLNTSAGRLFLHLWPSIVFVLCLLVRSPRQLVRRQSMD